MSAHRARGLARRAGAATGILAFAAVAGYWLLRAWAGGVGLPSTETILVRALFAAVAGFAVGWVACRHGAVLLGQVAGGGGSDEARAEGPDASSGDQIEGGGGHEG